MLTGKIKNFIRTETNKCNGWSFKYDNNCRICKTAFSYRQNMVSIESKIIPKLYTSIECDENLQRFTNSIKFLQIEF